MSIKDQMSYTNIYEYGSLAKIWKVVKCIMKTVKHELDVENHSASRRQGEEFHVNAVSVRRACLENMK